MKKVFEKLMNCEEMDVIKNCISILAESCEIGMNNECLLETLKSIKSEIDFCHYDEDMAKLHLCLIGEMLSIEDAMDYWNKVEDKEKINIWDWCVLWGTMNKQNNEKIHKWFPKISKLDYEKKVCDECLSFLSNNKLPFNDINL